MDEGPARREAALSAADSGAAGRPDGSGWSGYAELAARYRHGHDFRIEQQRRPDSSVAVLAPHGGGIERGTSAIARAIAGSRFNLYLFEGLLPQRNFESLHLTSHRFDEPQALALVARCTHVVAIHGCNAGPAPRVLLGGLDAALGARIARALRAAGLVVDTDGHRFPACHPDNLCNRGARRAGVQLELSDALRGGPLESRFVAVLRALLAEVDAPGGATGMERPR